MKVHWLNEGESLLVTGTTDPGEAKNFLVTFDDADILAFISDKSGNGHRANIVPQHPEAEYRWMWMANDNGRCKGVVFE